MNTKTMTPKLMELINDELNAVEERGYMQGITDASAVLAWVCGNETPPKHKDLQLWVLNLFAGFANKHPNSNIAQIVEHYSKLTGIKPQI
jgi:predicted NAD/FAD-dependent oxidoreductase